MASNNTLRYSDMELATFKEIIDAKLAKAKAQLLQLQTQIIEATQNSSDAHGADWMDDSSMNAELDMLNTMAIRQRKYKKELENALVRIRNKVYGICIITGKLIDKRRLMAVPTTTKSVAAKNAISSGQNARNSRFSARRKSRQIISRLKSGGSKKNRPAKAKTSEDGLLAKLTPLPSVEDIPMDQRPKMGDMD
ncbi:MAG: hypothetical protein KTR30_14345 [Saprospiraceae bacterium]|nr:hypothetical protein [Saprospiraceae bacterium]